MSRFPPWVAMGDRIRAGVIGMGRMGQLRRSLLASHPNFEMVACCDPEPRGVALLPGERYFADYRSMLNGELDAVFVCTTNDVTAEAAVAALEAGKHVFCEKPPGRSLAEARRILDAELRNARLKLKFGFNHRYHESIREALAILQSERLGRLLWIRGLYGKSGGKDFERNWRNDRKRSGGGILLDQGIHMLDLFRLFGGEFNQVKSLVGTLHWPIDVEDNAFVLLRNRAGILAMLHSSATQWKHLFSLDLYFSEGYITINGILSNSQSYGRETLILGRRDRGDGPGTVGAPREEVSYYTRDVSWRLELDEFADSILEDRPVAVGTSVDAVRVMELIEEVYRDDMRGRG